MNGGRMDNVPWLRKGTGDTPGDGGCIMQVIDWIDRNEWTDEPPCVHPVLRHFAIWLNDYLPDSERQTLLTLAPRMTGTATGDERLTRQLLGWLARQVFPIYEEWRVRAVYNDAGAVLACIDAAERGEAARAAEAAWAARAARAAEAARAAGAARAAEAAWAARAARAAEAARAARALTLFVGLLDRYDELTGRTTHVSLDFTEVCSVMTGAH